MRRPGYGQAGNQLSMHLQEVGGRSADGFGWLEPGRPRRPAGRQSGEWPASVPHLCRAPPRPGRSAREAPIAARSFQQGGVVQRFAAGRDPEYRLRLDEGGHQDSGDVDPKTLEIEPEAPRRVVRWRCADKGGILLVAAAVLVIRLTTRAWPPRRPGSQGVVHVEYQLARPGPPDRVWGAGCCRFIPSSV